VIVELGTSRTGYIRT